MENNKHSVFLSIITVVYNGVKHIEQTIQSVLEQSYANVEYILIDGGSTDGTTEIIEKYESSLKFWSSEPDKGIYDAMNKGIKKAQGEFVGIINSDDYYEKNSFRIIAEHAQKHSQTDVFFGDIYMINPNLAHKQLQTYKKGEKLHRRFSIWHPTVFVRRHAFEKYGLFDTQFKIAGDYELILRFYKKDLRFYYINEPIANFREGGTSYYNRKLIKERYMIHKKHTGFATAFINSVGYSSKFFITKILMKIIGESKYHKLRYKYLYS